jgi:hypothetical protein
VLEDITNKQKKSNKIKAKRGGVIGMGKENDGLVGNTKSRSHLVPGGSKAKQYMKTDLNESDDEDEELQIQYVPADSIVPGMSGPRPGSKSYFKCSLYSPSNRLYTVNEEVNSTQSDMIDHSIMMSNPQRISQLSSANRVS